MQRSKKYTLLCTAALSSSLLATNLTAMAQDVERISIPYEQTDAWSELAIINDETVETGVYVRAGANQASPVIGSLYEGGAAWVLNRGPEWTEICSGDLTGYVKNEYLLFGADAEDLAYKHGIEGVKTTWNDVKLFSDVDSGSEVVKQLEYGDSYILLEAGSHWIEVQDGADSKAYVSAEDVSRVLLLNTAVPKEGIVVDTSAYTEAMAGSTEPEPAPVEESYEASYTENTANTTEEYYESSSGSSDAYSESYDNSYSDSYSESYDNSYSDSYNESYDTSSSEDVEITYDESYDESGSVNLEASYEEVYDTSTEINWEDASDEEYIEYIDDSEEVYDADSSAVEDSYTEETYDYYDADSDTVVSENDYVEETTTPSASADDVSLLGALIYCEAGNQSYEGMVAVGAVVMNRVYSASFPGTISEVIYQGGQFTPAYSGGLASALASGVPSTCYDAAAAAIAGENPVPGALYFNTGSGKGTKIGAHQFY